jgi:hypothetical protein
VKSFINTTFNWLFQRSWTTILIALILAALFFYTYNGWIIFLSFVYFIPAAIIHIIGKRWVGLLASLLSLIFSVFLLFIWGISQAYFPEPSDVHDDYASVYENRERIESITGISIPEFTVESSKITHISQFDFEFTTEAVLKFKSLPSDKTFRYLDSLCKLYTPPAIDTTVSGSPQPEPVNTFWSKEEDAYYFSLLGNTEDKKLHSQDAFFSLTITKNSRIAKMRYGNY